jgi:hypothetical protein
VAIAPQPTATAATAAGHEPRARLANARPTQSDAARRCGEARLEVTAQPGREADPSARGRSQEPHRARRPR